MTRRLVLAAATISTSLLVFTVVGGLLRFWLKAPADATVAASSILALFAAFVILGLTWEEPQ